MTFATRHAHRAPRHALGPSAFCTGYTLSYPQAVRETPPPPPRDERAIARSLDVWRDLRGGTHGFGPRLGRGASVLRYFCRGVSTHRRVAFRNGQLTNIIGESKGRLTIRDDACSHGAAAKITQNTRATA